MADGLSVPKIAHAAITALALACVSWLAFGTEPGWPFALDADVLADFPLKGQGDLVGAAEHAVRPGAATGRRPAASAVPAAA